MTDDGEQERGAPVEVHRSPSGQPVLTGQEDDELSVLEIVNVVLRHRWKFLLTPVAVAALWVGVSMVLPSKYTSDASFVPQTGSGSGQLSQLSGVASQFGIDVPMSEAGESPQFYADLLTSRRLLEEAVTSRYVLTRRVVNGDSAFQSDASQAGSREGSGSRGSGGRPDVDSDRGSSLVELYDVDGDTRAEAVAEAAERLDDAVAVSANPETGMVELSVTTPWPAVSRQVVERLVELVNRFNNRVRQSQASAQAQFVGERLEEAERELRAAEDSLEAFLQRNVSWQQSPELRFRHDRLQRRVDLKQQVYTSLASRYEEARIDEVRSTPVVTVVTEPQIPARPDPSRLPLKAILGIMLGGMVGVVWAFGAEIAQTASEEETEDFREFVTLRQEAAEDVRRAGRKIRWLLGNGPDEEGS